MIRGAARANPGANPCACACGLGGLVVPCSNTSYLDDSCSVSMHIAQSRVHDVSIVVIECTIDCSFLLCASKDFSTDIHMFKHDFAKLPRLRLSQASSLTTCVACL